MTQDQIAPHISVLLSEVVTAFGDMAHKQIIDATFGAGGYSRAFLQAGAKVIAFDRDARVRPFVEATKAQFGEQFDFIERPFSQMAEALAKGGIKTVDGIALDIGVSSMQLDEAGRGFSFMRDGPLDMRMSVEGLSASDIINDWPQDEIAHVLWLYGEEHRSRAIAAAIVKRRQSQPFERTLDLADVIERAVGGRRGQKAHPATKAFQGLRIAVNDELGELSNALEAAESLIKPEGVLAVVTFHSLEDRMVKTYFAERSGRLPSGSRYIPEVIKGPDPSFTLIANKAISPSEAELKANPRARSAKLRVAKRTYAPAFVKRETSNLKFRRTAR
jgi:16S rRNA (cytosine1402-N4)-methyltransferase